MSSNTSALDENEVFEYMGNGQTVPKDVVSVRFHSSVVKAEEKAFFECSKLKKVVFNKGLKIIGDCAFCGCINLVEVVFNDELLTIGQRAFYGTALEKVILPKHVKEICDLAFYNCKHLREIDQAPHTLTEVGTFAFQYCNSLRKVGTHSFGSCPSLQKKLKLSIVSKRFENIIQYQPEVVTKVDAILDESRSEEEEEAPIADDDVAELWDLRMVLPIEQINDPYGQQCEADKCQLAACCIWSRNRGPLPPWYCCLDCQEKDFNGWPAKKRDIPLRVMSNELRNAMIQRSTKWSKYPAPLPNLPTGEEDTAVVPSDVLDSGVERRGSEIFVSPAVLDVARGTNWSSTKQKRLDQISKSIVYYEMKEGLTLFELALWKAKIDQLGDTSPANRSACRIEVPGPVKATILQYLVEIEGEVNYDDLKGMQIELKGESYAYEFPLDEIATFSPFPPLCFCCDKKARTVWSNTTNRWNLRLLCEKCCKK